MKDSKFIELLNLYVDHQISAADAALLEAEIQQSPKRRQVYRQYCQMQKACTLLADKFRSEAPSAAPGQVVEFETKQRRFAPFIYATGLMAAAACVALVLVNRSDKVTAAPVHEQVAAVSVEQSVATPAKPGLPALQPVFRGIVRDDASAVAVSTERAPLDWMTRVQFERVPAEALRFDAPQTMPVDDLVFRSQRVFDVQTEGAAFRFQR